MFGERGVKEAQLKPKRWQRVVVTMSTTKVSESSDPNEPPSQTDDLFPDLHPSPDPRARCAPTSIRSFARSSRRKIEAPWVSATDVSRSIRLRFGSEVSQPKSEISATLFTCTLIDH